MDIAISGISGRFPKCSNIDEFKDALLENKILLTEEHERWPTDLLGTPSSLGIVEDFDKFDANFFAFSPKQAESCDPRTRKLLEVVYETIIDSGHNINEVKGSKTGVFLGVMQSYFEQPEDKSCKGVFNRSIALMANQISYTFDLKGCSYALDTGCSSAVYGIDQAVQFIQSGALDSAIICTAQTHLLPFESTEFAKVPGILSTQNKCQPFDKNRSGYIKSEAVVAIFLQKSSNCKRIYATIEGISTNVDGYKEDGLMRPSWQMQYSLLNDVYQRFKINPNDIFYVENHGTGTYIGDKVECKALSDFFGKDRPTKLHIGSVKSNIGHTEAASGLVGLAKLIIAIQSGYIPATVNIDNLADDIDGINNGNLHVVQENLPFDNGLLALNSFGYGGANAHLIIKPFHTQKNITSRKENSIITVSGRTENSVRLILDKILENQHNTSFISLINDIFKEPIKNHTYRGFQVLSKTETRQISQSASEKRPVWFLYSGMGSQWVGMAKDIIKIPIFYKTIKKCSIPLQKFNINLTDILINSTEDTFQNCINCFVSIVAVSIGLTELLKSFNVYPDHIFGHSLGEICCAYADDLITIEEAMLIAYYRGYSTLQAKTPRGLMASIGVTIEELLKILPENIEVAAVNSSDNITVAGPEENVQKFVEELSTKGIFARIVNTANVAYHSSMVKEGGEILLDNLKKVIKEAKLRSDKWLSTSVPIEEWDSEKSKYNSAEYHVNNYQNTVLMKQILDIIPTNAVVIEIAPRGLLQAILRRYLDTNITKISLLSNLRSDNMDFFLSGLGKLYLSGVNLDFSSLQNTVDYPVGIKTPFLSSLIKWNHQHTWPLPKYRLYKTFGHSIVIDLSKNDNKYLFDHIVDGIRLFPAAGYIALVWEAFSFMHGKLKEDFSVVIKELNILNGIVLAENDVLKFVVNIFKDTGEFEIMEKNKKVSSGFVSELNDEYYIESSSANNKNDVYMKKDEFFKMMKVRGYGHLNSFQGITKFNITSANNGEILWLEKWIAFLDTIVTYLVIYNTTGLYLPNKIREITINPNKHKQLISENTSLKLKYNENFNSAHCGGVQIQEITGQNINKKNNITPLIKSYNFTPYYQQNMSEFSAIQFTLQTVIENSLKSSKIFIGDFNYFDELDVVKAAIHPRFLPNLIFNFVNDISDISLKHIQLLFVKDLCQQDRKILESILLYLPKKSFIFTNVKNSDDAKFLSDLNYVIVSKYDEYVLLRKKQDAINENVKIITIKDNTFTWWDEFKTAIQNPKNFVYLVTSYQNSGILGLFNAIREEYCCQNLRIYYINDVNVTDFTPYIKEGQNFDLTVNIFKNNAWGSYRYQDMDTTNIKEVKYAALTKEKQHLVWHEQSPYTRSNKEIMVLHTYIHNWQLQTTRTTNLGLDYTGVNENGTKYMGVSPLGTLKTYVEKNDFLTWVIPGEWNMSDASAMPLALAMSYYGVFMRGDLKENYLVLVYFENNYYSYGVIKFALMVTDNVYICIDKHEDMDNFVKIFPKLNEKVIFTNKKATLEEKIIKLTNRKGFDLIFNKVLEENNLKTDRTTKTGKIININYTNNIKDYKNNINITLKDLLNYKNLSKIQKNIQKLIDTEYLKPELKSYQETTPKNLQNFFINNKHEKTVIVNLNPDKNPKISAVAKTFFNPDKVYIIIGGLGGFALEMIDFMVKKGAKKIIVNSRSTIKVGYQRGYVEFWLKLDVEVVLNYDKAVSFDGCNMLMDQACDMGDVGGIFNLALVLDDDLMFNLTEEQFKNVVVPKLYISEHLDIISREKCKNLDHFVVFSSIASGLGSAGQSNYAFANSSIEMLCENRKKDNLPAKAIQWGPVGDVGRISNTTKKILNASQQPIQSCLQTLDNLLQSSSTIVSSTLYDVQNNLDEKDPITSVMDSIATLFGFKNSSKIDLNSSLINLGMDSIMSFEIRNILLAEFNIDFSSNDLKSITFGKIKNLQRRMSRRTSRYM